MWEMSNCVRSPLFAATTKSPNQKEERIMVTQGARERHFNFNPLRFKFEEPQRVVWKLSLRKRSLFLVNMVCRVIFGWMLERVDWEESNGRWQVTITWVRRGKCIEVIDDGKVLKFKMYRRVSWVNLTRLLWILVCSKCYLYFRKTEK